MSKIAVYLSPVLRSVGRAAAVWPHAAVVDGPAPPEAQKRVFYVAPSKKTEIRRIDDRPARRNNITIGSHN